MLATAEVALVVPVGDATVLPCEGLAVSGDIFPLLGEEEPSLSRLRSASDPDLKWLELLSS